MNNLTVRSAPLPVAYLDARTALARCEKVDECQGWAEPTQISPTEAKEAGKFLHVQAGEMRRRGDFLIELGDLGWK